MAADEILGREEANGIHRLVMNDGPNALNPNLMDALSNALGELADDGAPPVLVASAHEILFCPGWDLKLLAGAGRTEVADFLRDRSPPPSAVMRWRAAACSRCAAISASWRRDDRGSAFRSSTSGCRFRRRA